MLKRTNVNQTKKGELAALIRPLRAESSEVEEGKWVCFSRRPFTVPRPMSSMLHAPCAPLLPSAMSEPQARVTPMTTACTK